MSLVKFNSGFPIIRSKFWDLFDSGNFMDDTFFEGKWVPATNFKDVDKSFEVEVALPGFAKKDFQINVDDGMLTISAEKEESKEEKEENYTRQEFGHSSFSRSFTLPQSVNENAINASYEEGVLKLNLPKLAEAKAKPMKTISVN